MAYDPSTIFETYTGAWFDRSDASTIFNNVSVLGSVAPNTPGMRVGLTGDLSNGFGAGAAEIIPNPTFDTSANWSNVAGDWAIAGGKATYTTGGLSYIRTDGDTENGKWYAVRFTLSGLSGADYAVVGIFDGSASAHLFLGGYQVLSSNGAYDFVFKASADRSGFRIYGNASGTAPSWSIEGFSVKEVPGNHLAQTSDTLRPFESPVPMAYQVFDGADDYHVAESGGGSTTGFHFSAGIRLLGGASTVRTVWSDAGTNTGYRVRINASNQLELSAGNGSSYTTVATTATLTVGQDYVIQAWHDGANLNARVGSGTVATAAFVTATVGTAGFTVGRDNGAATSHCNMRLYRSVYVKNAALTEDDRAGLLTYCAGGFGQYSLYSDNYDLFLIGGQSNAVGVGDSAQSIIVPARQGAEYQDDGSVDALVDPTDHAFGSKSSTGSFLPAFAEKYYELTGRPVLFVSAARSGEGLTNGDWATGPNVLLPLLGGYYDDATALVSKLGGIVTPRGMLWLGGESDAVAGVSLATFKTAFIDLLTRVRTETGVPTLPILCMSIDSTSVGGDQANFAAIRQAQHEACDETSGMEMVLPYQSYYANGFFSDSLHWNQLALNDAGERAAVACAALFP